MFIPQRELPTLLCCKESFSAVSALKGKFLPFIWQEDIPFIACSEKSLPRAALPQKQKKRRSCA